MRLINADNIIESIKNLLANGATLEQAIDAQPTAFDLDKVIEKLENAEQHCLEMINWQGQSAFADAIEIVKGGGIDG